MKNPNGVRRPGGKLPLRVGMALLAVSPLGVGVWALFAPRSFFQDFPAAGRHWVSALGPYNEHLMRDVGALNLALLVLLPLALLAFSWRPGDADDRR
jgi:hypothetical protein